MRHTLTRYSFQQRGGTAGRAEDIFEKLKAEGEAAIDEFIALRQSEELYLDFKRSANDGREKCLHNTDLNNLGKAISGFGNSEGGVIVWGIDASADIDGVDVARLKMPIENIARFVSLLESSVSGRTLPPHPRVHHCSIELSNGQGFIATLIPKSSLAPHQSVPESKYYIRAGSNFIPAPHSVLAGMFGRRPQPEVFETFSFPPAKILTGAEPKAIQFSCNFQITNNGPVIARDLFSNVKVLIPQSNCTAKFECPEPGDWNARMSLGVWLSNVTKDGFRLAPDSYTTPFRLHAW
jgi:hypothetical protein